ncbi:MAG: HD domain-containing protein [Pseudomonadota bacterium]|nr:HD domain-containing protein [Pseudomonadota bacterium]
MSIYSSRGAETYFGEAVTTIDHSLQAAHFAQASDASDALIIAALLHDIGHLIEPAPEDIADWRKDRHHELSGSRWLATCFGPEVFEPVRLHVPAKRYLCATDSTFMAGLSSASIQTLKLQGGPMSGAEILAFEAEPFYRDAVQLRGWDDRGKIAGLRTPGFLHYQALIERLSSAASFFLDTEA